jgi:rhamnulokinase
MASGRGAAFVSSGTWSLVGVELPAPVLEPAALAANLTNEAGVAGTWRLLRNVMGLWLVQECRRARYSAGRAHSYEELLDLAAAAPPFGPVIDPDDGRFLRPGDMPAAIARACREGGQAAPREPGELVRCVLESIALRCRWAVERLEAVMDVPISTVHVVGGGARSGLLCQLTSDATGRPVIAGPVEATALGNLLVQALGLGLVGSLDEARELVRRSVRPETYEPRPDERWEEAWSRFRALLADGEEVP